LKRRPAGAHETSPALWSYYWGKLFSGLDMPVEYVDSDGQVLSFANAAERIGMKSIIRGLMAVKDHDNRYQDIPEIGHIGYSGSRDSWLRIAPLVDWSDASVVDCGSFYGYMLFRIRDAGCSGGRLIGMDFLAAHLNISRLVNRLRGDNVEFRQWNAGEKVPQADVTLCLNALHHFPDSSQPLGVHNTVKCPTQKFYDSIESPVTIFEAYTRYEPELRQNWDIVETFQSGREGRAIYRCKR
jgi:hypothetical protein